MTGRSAQRFIQTRAGFVSVTALLCLSAPVQLFAQGAEPGDAPPAPPPRQRLAQETPLPPVDVVVRPRPPRRPQPVVRAPAPAVVPAPVPAAPPTSTNYLVGESGTGRSTAPLINTPQTVTVVPQQIIREQASSTVMDALRNVPGITFRAGEGGAQGDVPYIRGFDARNDIFRDGVRDPGWYTRDSFSTDSVEVLKGPSSFMFGRGSTGGVINLNTKWPILGDTIGHQCADLHQGAAVHQGASRGAISGFRRAHGHGAYRARASGPCSMPTSSLARTRPAASRSWASATTFRAATTSRRTAGVSRRRSHTSSTSRRGPR